MGTSLNGLTPAATYSGLIKFGNNSVIGAAARYVGDGAGNDSPLALSSSNVGIGIDGALTARAQIKGTGSTSATSSLIVQNSANSVKFQVRDDGAIFTHGTTQSWQAAGLYSYAYRSPNGGSYINVDGGLNDLYDSLAALCLRLNASYTAIKRPTKIADTIAAPVASAMLEIDGGTTRGFLPPRMTTAQITAIVTPATGLVIYDTTQNVLAMYNGTGWRKFTDAAL